MIDYDIIMNVTELRSLPTGRFAISVGSAPELESIEKQTATVSTPRL